MVNMAEFVQREIQNFARVRRTHDRYDITYTLRAWPF